MDPTKFDKFIGGELMPSIQNMDPWEQSVEQTSSQFPWLVEKYQPTDVLLHVYDSQEDINN